MSPYVAAFVPPARSRLRKPWTVPLFGVLTLGIYLAVWYYRINRELRDLGAICGKPGRELDVAPGRSTLAVSLGAFLLVPPFVSVHRTLRRIQKAEQITDAPKPHLSAGKALGALPPRAPVLDGIRPGTPEPDLGGPASPGPPEAGD